MRFQLQGTMRLTGGVQVQPLVVENLGGPSEAPALLRQLVAAHPELAARLGAPGAGGGGSSGVVIHDAALLRVASDEIAGYRQDNGSRAWIYLEPDLSPGRQFQLQLVPDEATNRRSGNDRKLVVFVSFDGRPASPNTRCCWRYAANVSSSAP